MKPLFLCYPKCSTCRKAEQFLAEHGIGFTFRNIAEDAEFEESGFEFEDAPEDAGADVDVDFDDE